MNEVALERKTQFEWVYNILHSLQYIADFDLKAQVTLKFLPSNMGIEKNVLAYFENKNPLISNGFKK
tara:strand:- start:8578 stop:8778 length:201 start_codon:yes stop_codon:yes gene_type:complete